MRFKLIGCKIVSSERFTQINCVPDITEEDIIEENRRAVIEGKIPAVVAANSQLFYYGKFDDVNGSFDLEAEPKLLCNLADFVPGKEA